MKCVFNCPPAQPQSMRAGVLRCGRRHRALMGTVGAPLWLLKYTIYVILQTTEDTECTEYLFVYLCVLCALRGSFAHSAVNIELIPAPVSSSISRRPSVLSLWSSSSAPAPAKHCDRRRAGALRCRRRSRVLVGAAGSGHSC